MTEPRATTIHVIDTSVLVHDPHALLSFRETQVVVPIYVIMELDELKTSRRHEVAAAARIAARWISTLRQYGELNHPEGVFHPETRSTFRILAGSSGSGLETLERAARTAKMDLLILDTALALRKETDQRIVLVSKDMNLRLLADFEGIEAEDYDKDRVSLQELYTGYRRVEDVSADLVGLAYVPDSPLTPAMLGIEDLAPNEYVIVVEDGREHLLRVGATLADGLQPVPREVPGWAGVQARNIEQRMALDLMLDPKIELVSLVGKAGTGKTFLALAAAMAQLHNSRGGHYDRVLLSKPVISMGKDVGYLPGDFEAKMQPWMMSFFDNLDQLIPTAEHGASSKGATRDVRSWEMLFETRELEVQAIATIRGRSISGAFMVIDEAQNLTPHEVKTIITRAANGTKVILAGDPFQCDNHFLDQHTNGLVYVTERMKSSPLAGAVFFTRGERSRLAELAATLL